MIDAGSGCGVSRVAVGLEKLFYFVEQRIFRSIILGAELLRTLKHQMLEIVGEARSLCWVILSADADGDVSLDSWCILIDGHEYLQAVREGIHLRVQRVIWDSLKLPPGHCRRSSQQQNGTKP